MMFFRFHRLEVGNRGVINTIGLTFTSRKRLARKVRTYMDSNPAFQKPETAMPRELYFASLDDAIDECERLLETGYSKSGNWSLAQVCCHLRLTIESNMAGYPTWMTILGYPLRPILRHFMLPRLLSGNSPKGIRTAGIFVPPDNGVDEQEVDHFKQCVEEFKGKDGTMYAHPGFGKMSKKEFNRFHAAHAAHHLSFLRLPKNVE